MRKKGLLPLILGLLLLTVFASAAFAPEFFTSYSQKELFTKWLPMSREHLLGTNAMGYDILTELIYGARQTLLVGILSSILTLILGAGIGILGSFRGWIGQLFNGLIQIFVLLSKLVTLIVLATFFGSSAAHLIVLIAAFSWVGTARAVRAKVCSCTHSRLSKAAGFSATAAPILPCGTFCRTCRTCCSRAFCSG